MQPAVCVWAQRHFVSAVPERPTVPCQAKIAAFHTHVVGKHHRRALVQASTGSVTHSRRHELRLRHSQEFQPRVHGATGSRQCVVSSLTALLVPNQQSVPVSNHHARCLTCGRALYCAVLRADHWKDLSTYQRWARPGGVGIRGEVNPHSCPFLRAMVVALYHLTAAFAQDPMLYEDTNGVLHCVTHGGGWGDPLCVSSTVVLPLSDQRAFV
eukprot:COSAG01_NODE_2325_length_7907_cov_4.765881_8_plen_212_part_00